MNGSLKDGLSSSARVLVTGGSGFIGTNMMRAYLEAGISVVNLDSRPPRDESAREAWRRTDIRDRAALCAAVVDYAPTHVVHLAARTDLDGGGVEDYDANTLGVRNLIESVRALSTAPLRLVVASSRMVSRIDHRPISDEDVCPSTPYGASKVETERLVKAGSVPCSWVIGRPTSIWGPWFGVPYRDFFVNVARRRYLHPHGERIHKHFGFVLNTVDQLHALLVAPDDDVHGRILYLADDPPIEVLDLANRVSSAMSNPPVRTVPVPVLTGLAKVGDALERTGRRAPLTSFRLSNLRTQMLFDLAPITSIAGPPRWSLDRSVPLTVEWMKQRD